MKHVYKTVKLGSTRYYSSKSKAEARFGPSDEVRIEWLSNMACVFDAETGGNFGTIIKERVW